MVIEYELTFWQQYRAIRAATDPKGTSTRSLGLWILLIVAFVGFYQLFRVRDADAPADIYSWLWMAILLLIVPMVLGIALLRTWLIRRTGQMKAGTRHRIVIDYDGIHGFSGSSSSRIGWSRIDEFQQSKDHLHYRTANLWHVIPRFPFSPEQLAEAVQLFETRPAAARDALAATDGVVEAVAVAPSDNVYAPPRTGDAAQTGVPTLKVPERGPEVQARFIIDNSKTPFWRGVRTQLRYQPIPLLILVVPGPALLLAPIVLGQLWGNDPSSQFSLQTTGVLYCGFVAWIFFRSWRDRRKRTGPSLVVDLTAQGLRYFAPDNTADMGWDQVTRGSERPDGFVFYVGKNLNHLSFDMIDRPEDSAATRMLAVRQLGAKFKSAS